jgi:hypothetical protein
MVGLTFKHLNLDWNADPNAPCVELSVEGDTVRIEFLLNHWAYDARAGEIGVLAFGSCSRWRWDSTNDHAWFAGEGLFSGAAPEWGEFYEVSGDARPVRAGDWETISPDAPNSRQFLFYFRDDTLEIVAGNWAFERYGGTRSSNSPQLRMPGPLGRALNWFSRR